MKFNFTKKQVILALSILLATCLTVGVTLAYVFTNTDPLENTFVPSKVACEVTETFDGTVKQDGAIKNTGDTEAYIRATVVVNWKNAAGEVWAIPPASGEYSVNYNLTDGWIPGSDGFYYYQNPVAAGATTNALILRAEQITAAPEEGYTLSVEIVASAIQSTPTRVVVENWGVTVGADGKTISK